MQHCSQVKRQGDEKTKNVKRMQTNYQLCGFPRRSLEFSPKNVKATKLRQMGTVMISACHTRADFAHDAD